MAKTDKCSIQPILQVRDLKKWFPRNRNILGKPEYYVKAVDGVSFDVCQGETFSIVGESGCGKSTLCRAIIKLQEADAGEVIYNNMDICKLKDKEIRRVRKNIQMIFQDPFASLNPRMTVGDIIAEPIDIQKLLKGKKRQERIQELLKICGLDPMYINRYPHEFSGGQRQRIGIARALSVSPEIIICDEPLSALDVSIQSQIINLLMELQKEYKLTILFISHDLNVVYHISDRVMVMYLGKIVEMGTPDDVYNHTLHPYTKALIDSIPSFHGNLIEKEIIKGDVQNSGNGDAGCPFYPRCSFRKDICKTLQPELKEYTKGHYAACHFSNVMQQREKKHED